LEIGWYSNGNKMYETPYVNGNVHGLYKWWFTNGNKESETPYKKDIQHGSNIEFNY